MKVWAVFVQCTIPGHVSRWIDSLWAGRERANERARQLDAILGSFAFDVPGHKTRVIEMEVADASIRESEPDSAAPQI